LRIDRFHADIEVAADGSISVEETLDLSFVGSWNGLIRLIPVENEYRGRRMRLDFSVAGVTDGRGAPLEYEVERAGRYRRVKIWIPGANNTSRTVTVSYSAGGALLHFDADAGDAASDAFGPRDSVGYDELYWNVTGTEWDVPIGQASAAVALPSGVTGVRAHAFTGAYASTEQDAEVETRGGTTVLATTTRSLAPREGLTVGVAWDAGVVARPSAAAKAGRAVLGPDGILERHWPWAFPIVAGFLMFRLWWRRGRDPRTGPIQPQYEPPAGLSPAEAGVVIDDRVDHRDIVATIVDLARQGFLHITEQPRTSRRGDPDFKLTRLREDEEPAKHHERAVLRALFRKARRGQQNMSKLRKTFHSDMDSLVPRLESVLVESGVYSSSPAGIRGGWAVTGIVAAIVLVVGGSMVQVELIGNRFIFPAIGSGIATAAIVLGFGWAMPARTALGAEIRRHLLGFQHFLERVEGPRLKRLEATPDLFEVFLPYAIALGVEKQWAGAFADIHTQPPDWYTGADWSGFDTFILVSAINNLSHSTTGLMNYTPRGAGPTGTVGGMGSFGGGGFSGGGFGGGGGGGF